MDVIKMGRDLNKLKTYEFECTRCGAILRAREDDPALEWDHNSKTDFHFICPCCGSMRFMRTFWDQCKEV
jgi:DNA-directed RNA polymerase subunit RPC12/RpoP